MSILTDYYRFERIATKSKTRLDCVASTGSYPELDWGTDFEKGAFCPFTNHHFPVIIKTTAPEGKECLNVNVGKRIAELRAANDMSQQTLADLLFVSRDLVSKWENGLRRPDYQTIEKIAEVFRISVDTHIEKKDLVIEELSDCFPEGSEMSEERLTAVLNSFLRKSKPRNADLFLKRYYFQNTVTSIADEYGLRENHVRSILSKMRKRLKTKFAKEAHNDG